MKENDIVQSVEKAMKLLMLFEEPHVSELSIQQMSKSLSIPKSTAHRLASTLVKEQFLSHNSESKNYCLGINTYILGTKYLAVMTLAKVAKPYLESMVKKSGESVSISRLEGVETVIVDKLDGVYSMRVVSQIGKRNPLHCTGSGKIFLAYATEEKRNRLLEKMQPLTKQTDKTITEVSDLLENISEVKKNGFAFDDEEIFIGQTCIAAPIFDSEGHICAAMTVSGPKERIHGKGISNIGKELIAVTAAISAQLGLR